VRRHGLTSFPRSSIARRERLLTAPSVASNWRVHSSTDAGPRAVERLVVNAGIEGTRMMVTTKGVASAEKQNAQRTVTNRCARCNRSTERLRRSAGYERAHVSVKHRCALTASSRPERRQFSGGSLHAPPCWLRVEAVLPRLALTPTIDVITNCDTAPQFVKSSGAGRSRSPCSGGRARNRLERHPCLLRRHESKRHSHCSEHTHTWYRAYVDPGARTTMARSSH
jgi:hypothetical protein